MFPILLKRCICREFSRDLLTHGTKQGRHVARLCLVGLYTRAAKACRTNFVGTGPYVRRQVFPTNGTGCYRGWIVIAVGTSSISFILGDVVLVVLVVVVP